MKFLSNHIVILLLAVFVGIAIGYIMPDGAIPTILSVKQICGQIIFFLVPLIIIGFVAPSIANLQSGATRLILFAFSLAYLSSLFAAFFSIGLGYTIVPLLNIQSAEGGRHLPEMLFNLDIPPLCSVISALVIAVFIGLGTSWAKADTINKLLNEFQAIVLLLVNKVLLPILPIFIAANFIVLSWQGDIARLWVFLPVLLIIILAHYIWLAVLYGIATIYSGKNSLKVLQHYGPAYLSAIGTMSSAATLGVALQCAHKSPILKKESIDFAVPLFANIHLCGSVLTEVFFISVVSQLIYGSLPSFDQYLLFVVLLGIFAIGAPGVPGGTVLASLGLIVSVLGFDETGTAMLIAIYALQDSFGTACNITGDGALTLIVDTFIEKENNPKNKK